MIEQLLSRLGLEANEIKTYMTLLEAGPVTAGVLARKSGVVRPTQYVFLKHLIEKGYVTQSQRNGIQIFSAKQPDTITSLYEEKIRSLEADYHIFKKLLPEMQSKRPDRLLLPKFEIFEGIDGLKNVLKDMLLYRNMETQAYWPIKKMVDILSPEFFCYHNKERIRNNLYTRAIWPEQDVVNIKSHPYLGSGKKFQREIRIAPKHIAFSMGYWIYGNKVAFLSSRKESFGYIIESTELSEMLLTQFEVIWSMSKSLTVKHEDVKEFLEEI